MIWVCMLFVQGEDLYSRIVLHTKETLSDFLEYFVKGLLGDLSHMRRSLPMFSRDKVGIKA